LLHREVSRVRPFQDLVHIAAPPRPTARREGRRSRSQGMFGARSSNHLIRMQPHRWGLYFTRLAAPAMALKPGLSTLAPAPDPAVPGSPRSPS
jgi:hypothetical protein